MAENESFFRKVVRFVANPATDWTDLNSRQEDSRELELEKSELKAMIERKRRNDFVRKREFDMLRRVRREGLSPEQLATLGTSSRLDDSEARLPDTHTQRTDGVKAKIDEIEQQMVGDAGFNSSRTKATGYYNNAPATEPAVLARDRPAERVSDRPADRLNGLTLDSGRGAVVDDHDRLPALPPLSPPRAQPATAPINLAPAAAPAPVQMAGGLPPLAPLSTVSFDGAGPGPSLSAQAENTDFSSPFAVEVSEVVHDPELDEAVIAFANADFTQCEEALQRITAPGGQRAQHAETWLVLFDLYRATGQQQRFESLAVDYAQQFGWSAPQWYSMPRLVAEAASEERPVSAGHPRIEGQVGWVCPEYLDADAVARLSSQSLQMPLPWVFDWAALKGIDAEACARLSELFRSWIVQRLDMRWLHGERIFTVLQDAAPTGVRDVDPAYWQLRLDALRMTNRPDQFDEAAIDYCVTYEVSPPSWEAAKCQVRVSGSEQSTHSPSMSVVSDVSTSFVESRMTEDTSMVQVASVELSGQLVGDIGETLKKLESRLGSATIVNVNCTKLIRVDFIAAGDLLNWVLVRRSENRSVSFMESHRLVALFFGAMGINEHARVKVRTL